MTKATLQRRGSLGDRVAIEHPRMIKSHQGAPNAVVFTDDGRLVTCGDDGSIKVWPFVEIFPHRTGPLSIMPFAVASGPKGERAAALGHGGTLWLRRNSATDHWERVKRPADCIFTRIAFSSDGRLVAAARGDGKAELLTIGRRDPMILDCATQEIQDLAFAENHPYLVVTCNNHATQVWDIDSGELVYTLRHEKMHPTGLAISARGHLAVGGTWQGIDIYDLESGRRMQTLSAGSETLSLDWSADGRWLASGQSNGEILVWDVEQQATPILLGSHNTTSWLRVRFMGEGTRLASADHASIRLWHLPSRRELGILFKAEPRSTIADVAVTPDRTHLYAALEGHAYERNILVWPLK